MNDQPTPTAPWTCGCRQPGLGGDCDGSCTHPPPSAADASGPVLTIAMGELGPLGLSYAADVLEDSADAHRNYPMFMASLQMAVDFLRKAAAQMKAVSDE